MTALRLVRRFRFRSSSYGGQVASCNELATPLICPSGYFVSSARDKNISLPRLVETALLIPPSRPTEGRIRIVRDAGWDAVDAAALGAQRDGRAGWRKACERSNGALTNDVAAYGEVVWS